MKRHERIPGPAAICESPKIRERQVDGSIPEAPPRAYQVWRVSSSLVHPLIHVRRGDHVFNKGDQLFREGVAGKMYRRGEDLASGSCVVLLGVFLLFFLLQRVLGKQYDTMIPGILINTQNVSYKGVAPRVASDDNLSISFCSIPPYI